ncbi:hypothetical protein CANTEDRAFT_115964 [Yamadazyma tenuis ATCC 10573]|uniref:UspA domain-containing protein n=1 Tax=Candida tenuis (strain ATCC 10573 / BCRC 21748 / CBS 615 / JCM 9827 / NBRC 10315 / NRRL Y-1498 / VKM Y-70) TaxID=590646 RepID=G3BEM9_CANTC|nr:uncharacterized protein CANTEDRAFT_115964 [Yamadazyma tenuis ATCC 10573]EGV60952.1 hypothetical protein CANTEDRAFT_115964 [Yamadazyma tenuis ATCC 10573]
MRSHPDLQRRRSPTRSHEADSEISSGQEIKPSPEQESKEPKSTEDDDTTEELGKPREKKVVKSRNRERFDPTTSKNTKLNSLIYHTTDDSIDVYTKENDSSDLLGRIYYDDFDSESSTPIISTNTTPLISPSGSRSTSFTNLRVLHSTSSIDEKSREHYKYERGISFDTSTNIERISLTLKAKHPKFKFRRNNKTFLAGFNGDSESLKAIEWLFDEMIIHGDTIVILQVLDEKLHHDIDRAQCNRQLELIEDLNVHNKKISIVFEIVIGKPQKLLKKAIDEYTPQMMTIGMHSPDKESKGFFAKTTVSKYFLEYALVPVIVVKPTYDYIKELTNPIDNQQYFQNWLKNIDISETFIKDKKKKKMKSPLGSRSSSHVSLVALNEERGRSRQVPLDGTEDAKSSFSISGSRSPSATRSLSPTGDRSDSRSSQKRSTLSKLFHHR